jgi:hypothetical protein
MTGESLVYHLPLFFLQVTAARGCWHLLSQFDGLHQVLQRVHSTEHGLLLADHALLGLLVNALVLQCAVLPPVKDDTSSSVTAE